MKMSEMPDREKVITRLEEAMLLSETANECKVTLGYGIVEDAIALLKEQEPRLVIEADFANADECGYITAWCEASNGLFAECITIRALQETDFRYWTSRPTEEMMEATPWE